MVEEVKRKICPMCNARGKDLREVEDTTKNPIYYYGDLKKMYPKITICKKCGYEF